MLSTVGLAGVESTFVDLGLVVIGPQVASSNDHTAVDADDSIMARHGQGPMVSRINVEADAAAAVKHPNMYVFS